MRPALEELAPRIRTALATAGVEYAEVRISEGSMTEITLSGEQVDSLSTGDFAGGSVRVRSGGGWGFASFNSIGDIESFIRRAAAIVLPSVGGAAPGIRRTPAISDRVVIKSRIPFTDVPLDAKYELIAGYNAILRGSASIQTTRATYRDVAARSLFINTDDSELYYDRSYCGIALAAIARDGSNIQTAGESVSGYGGYEIAQQRESIAERAVKTAVDLLGAERVGGGTYDVITDQKLSGVFIHEAFGHLSEADFIHENPRMREIMTLGARFGVPELNVIDDGTVPSLSGYVPYDDEGVPSRKTHLIRDGILAGRLHSRETAAAMDEELTGNARAISPMAQPIVRMTNTYIDNGPAETGELFDAVGNGIYACDVIGGQTNLEMFTFSAGHGYEIKNGKRGKMLRDIVLSGNVFTTLNAIAMIANDRAMFGGLGGCGKQGQGPLPVSFGGPHMLMKNILIGGVQR